MRGAVVVMALCAAFFPSSAFAADASVESSPEGVNSLFFEAAPGELNQVELTKAGRSVTIHDSGAPISAGTGCIQVDANEVQCSDVDDAWVSLGDGADLATIVQGRSVIVFGGSGNDQLTSCPACPNGLHGQGGDDVVTGSGSFGRSAPSGLFGGGGDDTITGGPRRDGIDGGGGDNTIHGRGGQDLIYARNGNDHIHGGRGRDAVFFFFGRGPIVVNLRTGVASGHGEDTLISIRDVTGTRFDDVLIGNSANNDLKGLERNDLLVGGGGDDFLAAGCCPGDDELRGGKGSDRLHGGPAEDVLVGGAGRDDLHGDAGNDHFRARDGRRDLVAGGSGDDRARIDRLDRVRGIEATF